MLDRKSVGQTHALQKPSFIKIPLSLLALSLLVFSLATIDLWHTGFSWHDQQRFYQLILLGTAATLVIFRPTVSLPPLAFLLLAIVFGLGLASVWLAVLPLWALKEWGRYAGLAILVVLIGSFVRKPKITIAVLGLMASIGFLHAFQFVVNYTAAFISGAQLLQADLLFNGFSNPRFFGQFQGMLMPILALFIVQLRQVNRLGLAAVLLIALAVQWCIALTLGGRGLWLGLAVSHVALLCISRSFWQLSAAQFAAALLGAVLFIVLFHLIPGWLDLSPTLRDSLRTSLSGRGQLWQWAWEMALANPWFGVGPMHYAATFNPIAAHPHQVILQWAAEWGFVATILAMILAAWGIIHGAVYLRSSKADHYDAALWLAIIGALVLAQVDGVFVMPYTETWLAILIGLALGRWSAPSQPQRLQRYATMLLALPVVIILGHVLVNEVPGLAEASQAHRQEHSSGYTPRFWQQGWIPMASQP